MVLWDGILKSKYIDTVITPFSSRVSKSAMTDEMRRFDKLQSQCRNIIEHSFGCLKRLFPVAGKTQCKYEPFKWYFRALCIVYNIRNAYVESLRMVSCERNDCFICCKQARDSTDE